MKSFFGVGALPLRAPAIVLSALAGAADGENGVIASVMSRVHQPESRRFNVHKVYDISDRLKGERV